MPPRQKDLSLPDAKNFYSRLFGVIKKDPRRSMLHGWLSLRLVLSENMHRNRDCTGQSCQE
jgi:hypothetical protein